jgi:anti-anti-sigma factor
MVPAGSSFFTVSDRPPLGQRGSRVGPIVIWLWGEHDLSTDDALCLTLARAIALDSAGLVLDLSEVEFMGASTLGTIVRAREFLRQRSASLSLRSPSTFVRRVIDACNLNDLLAPGPEMAGDVTGKALGSRVAAPAAERSHQEPGPSVPAPDRVPARIGGASAWRARAVSADQLAETA